MCKSCVDLFKHILDCGEENKGEHVGSVWNMQSVSRLKTMSIARVIDLELYKH